MSTHKFLQLCRFACTVSACRDWMLQHNSRFHCYSEQDVLKLRQMPRDTRLMALYGNGPDSIRSILGSVAE